MRWKFEYIENEDYVRITSEGVFSVREHAFWLNQLVTASFWQPGMKVLFDNRYFDFGDVRLADFRRASDDYGKLSPQLGRSKIALLMKSRLDYGFGRQFQMVSEEKGESDINVFDDEQQALEWLLTGAGDS